MKKTLILLAFTIAASLVLSSCTIQIGGKVKSTTKKTNTQTTVQTTKSTTAATTAAPTATTAGNVSGEIPRGVWSGNVYTNAFADLSFTLPSGWTVYTDDQLATLMGATASQLLGDNYSPEILALTTIYDMMAANGTTGSNVMVMYENLEAEGATNYTLPQYIEALKTQLSAYGYYTNYGETYAANLCGNSYTVFPIEASGYNLKQYYYLRRDGNYVIAVLISSVGDDVSSIIANFK